MNVDEIRAQLEKLALKSGALTFGIADAAAFDAASEGHRPTDLLPGAKAVIVVGGAKPRAGDWRSPNYQHMELSSTNDRVTALAMRLAHHVERSIGYYAVVVPPGVDEGQKPFMSLALAAELAGCGTRSLAGPVLNPEHGFMYFAALLTTLPLVADGPLSEPVCPAPECVAQYEAQGTTPCVSVCDASLDGCLGGEIRDGVWAERTYDRTRCMSRVYNYWGPGFQKVLAETLDEPDKGKRRMMINSSLFTRTLWSMTYSNISQGQCFECMRVCPADSRHRELR
tara:strand:+ start:490 stop:1338 length:849 start_codon:yes stop_codon:yes gene_type:complete